MGLFSGLKEEGWASLAGKCVACGNPAKFIIRVNEKSTDGICTFRKDVCAGCWQRIEGRLDKFLKYIKNFK